MSGSGATDSITDSHSSRIKVSICGTGAMACLFGARLSEVADVTLLGTWNEGIEAIRNHGILLEGAVARVFPKVQARRLELEVERADLVLVLVKSWQTTSIAKRLQSLLKADGVAVTLQNGLGNLELLGRRACPGITSEGATLLGPGRVREGGRGPTYAAAADWILALLSKAGFDAHACGESEAQGWLWGKLAVNCAINALTALLRVPNGKLLACPETIALMEQAARECAAVAAAKGISLPFVDAGARAREIAQLTSANHSSMLQDILRGAPTECDAINGAVAAEGARLGIPTPSNQILWRLVRALVSFGGMDGA